MTAKKYLKFNQSIRVKFIVISSLLPFVHSQSCTMDRLDLTTTVINQSNNNLYVDGLFEGGCDSCMIKMDLKKLLSPSEKNIPPVIPKLEAKTKIQFKGKLLFNYLRIFVINSDSLDKYKNERDSSQILNKSWVTIISGKVNMENKTCEIVIK